MLLPAKEWKTIAAENNNRKTVFVQFVIPLLCTAALAVTIGALLFASLDFYSTLSWIATLWASLGVGLYLSAFFVTEIMSGELDKREYGRDFALMAYSSAAIYIVVIIVALFPFFKEFLVLALYSCYLYWRGIPDMIKVEGKTRSNYGLISLIITALIYSLLFFLFGKIFKSIN